MAARIEAPFGEELTMIDVIASIRVKSGHREEFIDKFKANLPAVLAEDGCIHYYPAVDAESGLAAQRTDPDTVTIVEKWGKPRGPPGALASAPYGEFPRNR